MLEEYIGEKWHRFISKRADNQYTEATVHLDEVRQIAGIFFRALGGDGGLHVESATDSEVHARRSVIQRIAGTGNTTQYAWRDEETLRLPESLALFPTRQLNVDLYLWLTALSVVDIDSDAEKGAGAKNWIARNQYRTRKILEIWPGLQSRYQSLLQAHLRQRPNANSLPDREAKQEQLICSALLNSDQRIKLDYAKRPPQPVPLWLHPSPPQQEFEFGEAPQDPDQAETDITKKKEKQQKQKRKQGNRADMPEGNTGLMSFRLESLWSWSEYTKVDRTSMDDDDDDALQTAQDMDNITVAQDGETTTGKIKLDLDLPANQYDNVVLGDGIPIDEWDYKKQQLQKDHCRIILIPPRESMPSELPVRLQVQARKVRRQFEMLRPQRHWLSRQNEGSEIDLESYINYMSDRKHGIVNSDTPVYRELRKQSRDLSCLLLADLSLSTDAYINDSSRVVDVIRDSLYLFSEALTVSGDRFALHGFSSRNRNHVRFQNIKNFDDAYDDTIRGHIDNISPSYYTRMGTAIRYASDLLEKESSSQKLLLILTDGKPNDLDKYESRYGLEDTRHAIIEAKQKGLQPFCVTIDEQAEGYLPYLFGKNAYVLIKDIAQLPDKLPLLYLRLTR